METKISNRKGNYSWFYTLLKKLPDLSKAEWVSLYTDGRTDSLREMSVYEYETMCSAMERETSDFQEKNKWRKRAMGAISGWLRAVNCDVSLDSIMTTACRASGYEEFNKIPVSELRGIYHGFNRNRKALEGSEAVSGEEMMRVACLN